MADVLIVDDDADLRLALGLQLQSQGHEVRTVDSAEAALLASAERRPDLLLLDLQLEGREGDELIRLLDRGLGRPRRLCLLSGRAEAEVAEIAGRHDVAYLIKPVAPAELERVVADAEAPPPARVPEADGDN